ncbi:type I restriction-modification system subunit M [Sphingobium sp. AS12]|uniref:type I restriction-modification system subunit M n=1 Tax=Sphingobium sp. AS12 TaxID=2849495 RepID=UPI001C3120DF|nr:class I SAM-dependent DNA methyltransferase [Sphingobium sp. AS12]MBV2150144.1 type I restriction-modification system subunit M [Sphingobium sp. AS12]
MSVRTLVKSIQDIMRKDSGVDGDAQRISQLCWLFFLKIIDDQDQELELMRDGYQSPVPDQFQWRSWAADPEGLTGEALLTFINEELFPAMKGLKPTGQPSDRRRVVRDVFEDAYNYMKSGQLLRQVVNKINDIDFNNLSERQHFGDVYETLLNDLQSAGNAGEYYTPRAVTAFMVDRIDPKPGEIIFDPSCGTGGFLTCAMKHMRDRYVKRPEDEALMQASLRAVEKKPLPHMLCVTNMLLHGVEDPSFVRHDNTLARPYISWEQKDRVDVILTNPPFGGKEEDGIESNFPQHFRTRETADLFLALFIRLLRKGGVAAIVLPDGSLFGEGVKTRLKEALLEECNLHTIVRLPNSVFKPYASIGTNLLFFEKGEPTKDVWFYEHQVPLGQKAYSMTRPIRQEHFAPCVEWWGGPDRKGREEGPQSWKVSLEDVKARGYNLDFKNPHSVDADHGDPAELLANLNAAEVRAADLRAQLQTILAEALAR